MTEKGQRGRPHTPRRRPEGWYRELAARLGHTGFLTLRDIRDEEARLSKLAQEETRGES